jgi:predicted metal-binding membrane protein
VSFLIARWGRGPLRLGAEHGAYCVGCCWGLMTVLVVAGAMQLAWAAAIALVVFVEKVLPPSRWVEAATAGALVGLGVAVAVDPELAMVLNGSEM